MIMVSIIFFNLTIFCVIFIFFTKLLTLGILFSTAVRAVILANLVILGISTLTSSILVLRVLLVAKLEIPGILSSIFLILALFTFFYNIIFYYIT